MKILLIAVVLLFGCHQLNSESLTTFIPGTYIRFSAHEFGKEYDTLLIQPHAGFYTIERRWKYERLLDGSLIEPEYKLIKMTVVLNNGGILTEQQTGVRYVVDVQEACLYDGKTRYEKIRK